MRSVSVDLNNDSSLLIDIPDALCERDKVKFTVHTKVKICMRVGKVNIFKENLVSQCQVYF